MRRTESARCWGAKASTRCCAEPKTSGLCSKGAARICAKCPKCGAGGGCPEAAARLRPEAPAAAGNPAQGGLPPGFPGGLPGGLPPGFPGGQPGVVTPPVRRPVEAVTPPIAIPPLEEEGEAKPAEEQPKPENGPPAENGQ